MRIYVPMLTFVLAASLTLSSCRQEMDGQRVASMEIDMEALSDALAQSRSAFEAAYASGDAAALAAMWAEDGMRLMPYRETFRGREAVENSFSEFFEKTTNRALELETIDFGASGDLAYTVGKYTLSYEMDGAALVDEGKYMMVLRRTPEGEWQIVAAAPNSNRPPPTT